MPLHSNRLAGVLAVVISSAATAQAQPAGKPAAQTPPPSQAQTQTTTPTTTSTKPPTTVPDEPAMPQRTAPGQTGTTPGQEQTTPGEASQLTPAQTGQTPSGQSVPNVAVKSTAATKADVKAGASVFDQNGAVVGKIVSTNAQGAVIDTGTVKATIPTSSFAKGDKGLIIGMSKSDIEAAAKRTKPAKKPK